MKSAKRYGLRGFTLIELMVVMLIISVMIGAATITLKRDYKDLLTEDANRLRALVSLARDEALFQARSLGLRFSEKGYGFVIRGENGGEQHGSWEPLDDKQFRQRQLGKGVQLEIFRNNTSIALNTADGGQEKNNKPQVFLLSSGEVTPFLVEFVYPARAKLQLRFDALGQSEIFSNEEF